jgi:cytochrome P450
MTETLVRPAHFIPADLARDVVDPKAHTDEARFHGALTWLRANEPLGWCEIEGFDPFWIVTKHADILEISRQNALFPSGERQTVLTTKAMADAVLERTGSPHLVRSLVQMDAPDHPKYRALTVPWFAPANVRKREAAVREIARESVDRMASMGGRCDFVSEVALHYPLRVIMNILGVPREDEPRMLKLTQELFGAQDPELNRTGATPFDDVDAMAAMQATLADFFMYFDAVTQDRRANPRDDVATVIANAQIDGEPIAPFEAVGYYVIVATAGHDTTSSSTAGAVWALANDPVEFAKVKADAALIPGLVDEAVRWTTPVKHFMRSATEDYALRGRTIRKGDWLYLAYPSGNRDEEVFEDPFAFRSDRSPNKHVAFGYGAHLCLGQHLAKLEMRILFEELLPRLRSLELDGTPRWAESGFVGGLKTLPIRYTMD